jgi:hypothetical protein
MRIIQINLLNAQPLQAPLAGGTDIFTISTHRAARQELVDSELGGKEYFGALPSALEPLAQKHLVVAVDIGRVPKAQAELVSAVQDRETLGVGLGGSIKGGETLFC